MAILVVGGFGLFRYLPLQSKMKAVRSARAARRLAISRDEARNRQLPVLEQELLKLRQSVGDYESTIPQERALGRFLGRIAALMNEHNLKEQAITPGQELTADKLKCVPVSLQCQGSLSQIFEFYRQLQKLDRLIRIEHVKLVNDPDFAGRVSMDTKAVMYYRTQVKQG